METQPLDAAARPAARAKPMTTILIPSAKGKTCVSMGGIEIEVVKMPAKETTVKVNISRVGRHSIGPFRFTVYDGDQPYEITVEAVKP
jgi:hypothetical protein